jgi:hypothetical protein
MPKKPIEPEDDDDNDDTTDPEEEETETDDTDSEESEVEEASSPSSFSWDTDDAESGGLPEGRVVLMRAHTRLASTTDPNQDDDDDGYPVLSIMCVPVDGGEPFSVHLSAGKAARLIPSEDGGSFQPAEGSSAKGLSKSSNCFYFIKSLEDAGFPKDKIRSKGISIINGTEAELHRVDQPKRRNLVAVDEETGEERTRTMPTITTIYSLPWEKKGLKAREAAELALKGKGKGKKPVAGAGKKPKPVIEDDDEEEEAQLNKKFPKAEKKGAVDLDSAAEKAVMQALNEPSHKKKGLPETEAYPAAFQYVQKDPNRKGIMALIKDDEWLRDDDRPWAYDPNLERLTLVG